VTLLAILVAVLTLAPGLYAWWTGRDLLGRLDDPAFPELLLAREQRRSHIIVAALVIPAFVPGTHWIWSLPLFVVASLVGGFHFRRTLYAETWHVGDYLRYTSSGFVGAAGFWITLAFTPALILALVEGWLASSPVLGALAIGATMGAVLVTWEITYPLVWLALHRASPLQRADLLPRFDEIVRRSSVATRPPHVFRYGTRGAYVMNAVALASFRQPRVAFGDSLLELLTPDEIAAVFAHEVSHLEHYDRRRILRIRLVTYLLILGGVALPPLILASVPEQTWTVKLLWPLIVLVLLALRLSKSQAHETESDIRAGVLTGDPEAMVRALTKLHHYSRMPRRWPYDFERAASHPSLARRIQALRTQLPPTASTPAGRLEAPAVLRSTEPGAYAALDESRAYWFDGVPVDAASLSELREQATSYRAVAYADLTELRVAVVRGGGRALLARDQSGKTWSMPLRPDDVPEAQRALDVLDVRLAKQVRENWPTNARGAATVLALTLLGALDFSWTWIPLIVTLVKPTAASVAAMGAMAVGQIVVGALAGTIGISTLGVWPLAAVAWVATFAVGVWCCRMAWRWAGGDHRPTRRSPAIFALTLFATFLAGVTAMLRIYGTVGMVPPSATARGPVGAVALLLLGAGAALITYRDRFRRRSGAATVAAGLLIGAFAANGGRLMRRVDGRSLAWTTGQAEVVGRAEATGSAYRLHLSPGGRAFAIQAADRRAARYADSGEDEGSYLSRFTVGTPTGERRTTGGLDLAFVDDERLLVLRPLAESDDSLELSLERASGGDSTRLWRLVIPAYYAPNLALDRANGTWRVTGYDVEARTAVTSLGRVGGDSITTTRLAGELLGGRPVHTYPDGTSLIATLHGSFGKRQMLLAMLGFYPYRWDIWRVGNGQRRSVATLPGLPECGAAGPLDGSVVCVARGRSGVSLWGLSPADNTNPTPLGDLPGSFDLWDIGPDGRLAGATRDGTALVIVDARAGRATRIALDGGGVRLQSATHEPDSFTIDVASATGLVGTLVTRGGKSEATFYRVR
jgi:Zn-dependent protease with chaperone function